MKKPMKVDASPSARLEERQCQASFEQLVDEKLASIREMLLDKNRKYGDSALNPLRVFSKASAIEQLLVRIDDKLSRIRTGTKDREDTKRDLIGYLVLLLIAEES